MSHSISAALRLLGHFWLEEVKASEVEIITALPELAQALPNPDSAALDSLAVEYQRLFGFYLPPYESVFIDPSAMLMAPATEQIQSLYRRGAWSPPPGARTGAPDHIGLELLALADWLERDQSDVADWLHSRHLALWGPPFILTLRRLAPHPFYVSLGDLTLELILATLPAGAGASAGELFPDLPPAPVYRGTDDEPSLARANFQGEEELALQNVVKRCLTPREAGLFLTRQDIARISQTLDLPGVVGERFRMLEGLFRLAGQYDLLAALFAQLTLMIGEVDAAYQHLAREYPPWTPYAQAWRDRLATSRAVFGELKKTIVKDQ